MHEIGANPNDIRLRGSDEHMIVSITEVYYERDITRPTDWWPPRYEWIRPDAFVDLRLFDLDDAAFLSADTSRKIPIVRFDRPSVVALH